METKLTIKLPEELRRRAKAVAALRGETVSDVVREALQDYIADAMEEAEDVRAIREIEARIARGEEPVND
jgi:predicted DNA-binding protein